MKSSILPAILLTFQDRKTVSASVLGEGIESDIKLIEAKPDDDMASFELDGDTFSVTYSPEPMEAAALSKAITDARTWPDAERVASSTTGCLVIAPNAAPKDRESKLALSLKLSRVVAAFAKSSAAPALYWPGSGVLMATEGFVEAALQPDVSIGLIGTWIGITWFKADPEKQGDSLRLAATTNGLARYVGKEIDLLPSELSAAEIAEHILLVARYLITEGVEFNDGDTLGFDGTRQMRVAPAGQGYRPEITVYRLQIEA